MQVSYSRIQFELAIDRRRGLSGPAFGGLFKLFTLEFFDQKRSDLVQTLSCKELLERFRSPNIRVQAFFIGPRPGKEMVFNEG